MDALLACAGDSDPTTEQARSVLREIADAASDWVAIARRNGIVEAEIARFEVVGDPGVVGR